MLAVDSERRRAAAIENCPRFTWGQTEVRVSLSVLGCTWSSRPPAPSEADLGRGQPRCGHAWCVCNVAGGCEVFGEQLEEEKSSQMQS